MNEPPKLRTIEAPDRSREARQVLEDTLAECDGLEVVVVLAIAKDGSQVIRTSGASHQEKCFLLQFFSAWLARWFFPEE